MPEWTPERPVDAGLATSLVHRQFPALRGRLPRYGGAGWDNVVWRFGDLAFRFPQRQLGADLIEVELLVLPQLQLPVAIPAPVHVGEPDAGYPWRFYGAPWLPGTSGRLAPGEAARLGATLRVLHAARPTGLPDDTYKSWPERRVEKTLGRLGVLAGRWDVDHIRAALLAPTPSMPPWVTCHGDLYARHVITSRGRLTGLIDWGDVRRGNPGMDLNLAWSLVDAQERDSFWAAYGQDTPELRAWARFYALNYGVLLASYGLIERKPAFVRLGERALTATLPAESRIRRG